MMSRPLSTWRLAIASGVSCWGITRSSFLRIESYSSCVVDLIGPRVNDGVLVEVIHGGHEPILEFLLGGNANVDDVFLARLDRGRADCRGQTQVTCDGSKSA